MRVGVGDRVEEVTPTVRPICWPKQRPLELVHQTFGPPGVSASPSPNLFLSFFFFNTGNPERKCMRLFCGLFKLTDPQSNSVVGPLKSRPTIRLSRPTRSDVMSCCGSCYTTRDLIRPLPWQLIGSDLVVELSLIVDGGL